MDMLSKVYVPDHLKWEKYYEDLLSQRLQDFKYHDSVKQPEDFLASSKNTAVPKEPSSESVKVKLVSPVKQANDQVVSELRRDSDSNAIKAGTSKKVNTSMKRHAKRGTKKRSGNKKQKGVRRRQNRKNGKSERKTNKKIVKRRIKDIFTL